MDIVDQCKREFKTTFPNVPLPPIEWNKRMRSVAGKVKIDKKTGVPVIIQLNPHLLNTSERTKATLLHELAHVANIHLNKDYSHGMKWKICMIKLGQAPNTYHNYDTSKVARKHKRPYKAICKCPGKVFHLTKTRANRIIKNKRIYTCKKCSSFIKLTGGVSK